MTRDRKAPERSDSDASPEQHSGGGAQWGTVGEYVSLAFVFPLALVLGFFLGRWVGGWLGGPTVGAITGLLLGTVAAFYNLWETLRRLERRDAAKRAETED